MDFQPSFVDGIGSKAVLRSMYDPAVELGISALAASADDVRAAVLGMLEFNRVLAEGAGATPAACAVNVARGAVSHRRRDRVHTLAGLFGRQAHPRWESAPKPRVKAARRA